MADLIGELRDFANWIEARADLAGFRHRKVTDSLVVITYDLAEGRTKTVGVTPLGKDPNDNIIICLASPALKLAEGQHLSQKTANELLRQNGKLLHGAWAIQKIEGNDYLVMRHTHISETMDSKEFVASVEALATLADRVERQELMAHDQGNGPTS